MTEPNDSPALAAESALAEAPPAPTAGEVAAEAATVAAQQELADYQLLCMQQSEQLQGMSQEVNALKQAATAATDVTAATAAGARDLLMQRVAQAASMPGARVYHFRYGKYEERLYERPAHLMGSQDGKRVPLGKAVAPPKTVTVFLEELSAPGVPAQTRRAARATNEDLARSVLQLPDAGTSSKGESHWKCAGIQ